MPFTTDALLWLLLVCTPKFVSYSGMAEDLQSSWLYYASSSTVAPVIDDVHGLRSENRNDQCCNQLYQHSISFDVCDEDCEICCNQGASFYDLAPSHHETTHFFTASGHCSSNIVSESDNVSNTSGSWPPQQCYAESWSPEPLLRNAWTEEEHNLFLAGLEKYGDLRMNSKRRGNKSVGLGEGVAQLISLHVRTRSASQVRSHAQKYFSRLHKTHQDTSGK